MVIRVGDLYPVWAEGRRRCCDCGGRCEGFVCSGCRSDLCFDCVSSDGVSGVRLCADCRNRSS